MSMGDVLAVNYSEIQAIAKKFSKQNPGDLIHETYLRISEHNGYPRKNKDFVKWFAKCMHYERLDKYSQFTKATKIYSNSEKQIPQPPQDKSNLPGAIEIERLKKSLPLHQRYLFELHYIKGLSSYEIANDWINEFGYEMNYKRIQRLLKPIKDHIEQWKQLNL